MSKKKIGIIIAVVIIIAAAAGGGVWYLRGGNLGVGNKADKVFVEKVSNLSSANSGVQNRYSGVVEPQESWKVDKDMEREIKEVFVEEGDMVEEGDSLFEYNMEDVQAELDQAELDLEEMQNEITDLNSQISQLTKERDSAPSEEKFKYTAEIQEKQNEIKQKEYNIESKKSEMEKKKESIDHAVVTSKLAGVVKSINKSNNDDMGSDNSYMTILAVGDYRIKGTVSESNVQMLSEDQPVILRSRIDEDETWTGTITKIDTQNESTDDNNDMMYYDSSGGGEKATKYPFYVTLDSADGLMMGQHLFIELDQGQTEEREGIWLFEGYIVREHADGTPVECGMDMEYMDGEEDMEYMDGEDGMDMDGMDGEDDMDMDGMDGEGDADLNDMDAEDGADLDDMDADSGDDTDAGELSGLMNLSAKGEKGADAKNGVDLKDLAVEGEDGTDAEDGIDLTDLSAESEDSTDAEDGIDLTDLSAEGEEGSDASGNASSADDGDIITYVWAANDKNKLEKRKVELGEYDEATGEYEILSGLTEDDYIAFPMEGLYEGVTTVTSMEEVDYTSPLYNQGEEGGEVEEGEEFDGETGDLDESFGNDGSGMIDESLGGDMSDEDFSDDSDLSGDSEDDVDLNEEDDSL